MTGRVLVAAGRLRRGSRRLSGFAVSTIVTGLIGVLVVPVIVANAGPDGWSAVAIGTACGSVGAIVSGFGWAVTGPGTVAVLDPSARRAYFRTSFFARGLLALVALPGASWVATILTPPAFVVESAMIAASVTVLGLGANWYFVGVGAPLSLLLADTLPRSGANVAGALLLMSGFGLIGYSVAQLSAAALTVALGWMSIMRGSSTWTTAPAAAPPLRDAYREQLPGFLTAAVASIYQSLPTIAIAAMRPESVAAYALADRLLRLANTAQAPFSQTLQSWVPSSDRRTLLARARRASLLAGAVGLSAGIVLGLLTPMLSHLVGAGRVGLAGDIAVPLGIALSMTILSQCVGIACLVPLGRSRAIVAAAVLGSVVAAIALLALVPAVGAPGAMWAVAGAEIAVVAVEITVLVRIRRNSRTENT